MTKTLRQKKPLIYAIVGPTASGKSEFAVSLAKKIGGEVISVDSRQIYKGMDLGTGKVKGRMRGSVYTYKGIPHYGIDIASPRTTYSSGRFQIYANKVITNILRRGKIPILCGGTAHWMDAVVYDQKFPDVKRNYKLRARLEKKSTVQLFAQLKRLDPKRAATIDAKNPRRLIRALEIVLSSKQPVPELTQESPYTVKWIGLKTNNKTLSQKIKKRLNQRIKQGMFHEVKSLHKQGISWKRLESFGLEYKYSALYLQNKLSKQEALDQLLHEIQRYSKRQMTWWKRNKNIKWRTI